MPDLLCVQLDKIEIALTFFLSVFGILNFISNLINCGNEKFSHHDPVPTGSKALTTD